MAKVEGEERFFKFFEISHTFSCTNGLKSGFSNYLTSPFFNLSFCGKNKKFRIRLFGKNGYPDQVNCIDEKNQAIPFVLVETSENQSWPLEIHKIDNKSQDVRCDRQANTKTFSVKVSVPIGSSQTDQEKEFNQLMLQQMDLADSTKVTFICDGESYLVNKLVLKARSAVLKRILDNPKSKEAQVNEINFVDHPTAKDSVKLFCDFLNTLEIPECSLNLHALDLFRLGEMYEVKPLAEFCVESICKKINIRSFVEIFSLAYLHKNHKIMSAAKNFYKSNTEDINNLEEWKDAVESQPFLRVALTLLEAEGE